VPEENNELLSLFKDIFKKLKEEFRSPAGKRSAAVSRFLDWMETLDYNARCKRVVDLGRESIADDPDTASYARRILAVLEAGSFYERELALLSCHASKDCRRIMRFSRDSSETLRRLAADLAVRYCSEAELLEILHRSRLKERRRIFKKLRRAGRLPVIDSFLKLLAEKESPEFNKLVYFGTPELVGSTLPELEERLSPEDARRLASLHPDLALEFFSGLAAASTRDDPRLLSLLVGGALDLLSRLRPDGALTLFESLLAKFRACQLPCRTILNLRPAAASELFARQSDYGGVDLSPVLHRLPDHLVVQAVNHRQFAAAVQTGFNRFAPALRQNIFAICCDGWLNVEGAIPLAILEQLDREARAKQARKHLALANFSTRIGERLNYARLLEWDEARQTIAESLASPDPGCRAAAFYNLVYAVKFNRARLPEVLELLHKHKNEPDPVRERFLAALTQLPPSAFSAESMERLGIVIDDAFKAADLSFASQANIGRLLVRLFPLHAQSVAAALTRLLKERGAYMLAANPMRLLDAEVRQLSPCLKEAVQYWQAQERESEINQLGAWLAIRLGGSEPVLDALADLARDSKIPYNAETAARVLFDFERRYFERLVPELLKLDPTWSVKPLIYEYLGRKRQSLLTPYLGQTLVSGRFATGKNRMVPGFTSGFHRWTARQLQIYREVLCRLVVQESSSYNDRTFAICRLCLLPEPPVELLAQAATLASKDEALRDLTIRQMACTDNNCGLPVLLECLEDERATRAIYALRTAVLAMEPGAALAFLKKIPCHKVTVFKEVVRLAGEIGSQPAFEWLKALVETDLHRDVRLALLRALWNYLEKEDAWLILKKTVQSGDPVFAEAAVRIPQSGLSKSGRAQLLELYRDALDSKNALTRVKTLQQISASTLLDPLNELFDALGACLASDAENECRAAAWTAAILYAGRNPEVLSRLFEGVAGKARNLRTYLQQMQLRLSSQPETFEADARVLCAAMKKFPRTAELSVELAAAVLPWQEFYEMLVEFERAGTLHFGVMQAACQCLRQPSRPSTLAELAVVEEKLKAQEAENLRRLGLAALCGLTNSASGWTAGHLSRLRSYRQDPSLMVASYAEFILPSAELVAETQSGS
jgi:hypothetical protein